eukprot:5567741-Pyramimonas_sp.AAC.1
MSRSHLGVKGIESNASRAKTLMRVAVKLQPATTPRSTKKGPVRMPPKDRNRPHRKAKMQRRAIG